MQSDRINFLMDQKLFEENLDNPEKIWETGVSIEAIHKH